MLILGVFEGLTVLLTVYETLGVGVGDTDIEGVTDFVFTHSEQVSWPTEGVVLIVGVGVTETTTCFIKLSKAPPKSPTSLKKSSRLIGSLFSIFFILPMTSIIFSTSLLSGGG